MPSGQHSLHAALIACATLLSACGGNPTDPPHDPPGEPAEIRLNTRTLNLFDTETYQVVATLLDDQGRTASGTVTWSSGNAAVATVDAGTVLGVSRGATTVEARFGTLHAEVAVSVIDRLDLEWPLLAVVNRDVYFTNYVDMEPGVGLHDYQCGARTYDGHRGVDIALANFAVMDSGVTVVAGAPGRVITAVDGMLDRNTVGQGGGLGNHVEIAHRDGMVSRYGHMVNGSVAVAVGDSVMVGTTLGLVGSSGNSDGPHLHFELLRQGLVVDPYSGPCSSTVTQWSSPLPYQDAFAFIASGVVNWQPTLDQAKEGLPHLDTLSATDPTATLWVQLHNLRLGAQSRWILRTPSSGIYGQTTLLHDEFYMLSYWWAWWTMPSGFPESGTWRFEYYHDNQLLAEREFEVPPSTAMAAAAHRGASPSVAGEDGGGVGRPPR